MKRINFTKMVASGNDFIVVDSLSRYLVISLRRLAQELCNRKYGIGADGLLVLEKSKVADINPAPIYRCGVKMRIFNADGSEAEMCGNGARCAGLYIGSRCKKIETKAGIIETRVNKDNIQIKLTDPKKLKLNIPLKINNRLLRANFINTGVPHTVIFVEGLDKIDVVNLGRQIRYHHRFQPAGTNADFAEVFSNNAIKIRTYERGVEDETSSCGTGTVAAALITGYQLPVTSYGKINVQTKSGEVLKVYFKRIDSEFKDVWLEGKAKIVYTGVYNV